jgi:hypothetical protein
MIRTSRLKRPAAGCFALAGVLATSPSANAQAQTDPAAIVRSQETQSAALAAAWLGSRDARVRAWGAYLALRDRRRELLPQLIGLAEAYSVKAGPLSPPERDDHNAMLGVLDAVIQMDGKVPPEEAAPLYREFPVQALILLAREGPAASSFLLNIFLEENSPMAATGLSMPVATDTSARTLAWLAVGDLLMNLKPPGFAASVLGGLTVDIRVRVVDEGSGTGSSRGFGASCSGGLPSPWPGWPPVGNYSFAGPGHLLLAGGTDPSFYTRTVGGAVPNSRGNEFACDFRITREVLREHFLASLAGDLPGDPSVRSSVESTITWRNNELYLQDLCALIDRQQSLFETLTRKLIDARLMSADEVASSRPSLHVRTSDERSKKLSRLPLVQHTESNVTFMNE